jgi:hypothetical protein
MLGVAVLSLRVAGGLTMAHRLATRALEPVSDDLQRLAVGLAARLRVRTVVRVCQSASVAVPVMIGWLRPVIVLPPVALAALPLSQLEALLAHEFAHVRRHDYLVNLLQTAVETLCFYHPGVWWISAQVRREREHCCDDVAVGVCDRLTYVTALSTLASFSSPAGPQFALAASGGSLRDRIRRLVDSPPHSPSAKGGWLAMLPILLLLSLVAPHAWGADVPEQTVRATVAPRVIQETPVPIPVPIKVRPVVVERRRETATLPAKVAPVRIQVQPDERRIREEQLREVAERRLTLEQERELVRAHGERVLLESRLRQAEADVNRTRTLAERNLATREALAAVENRLLTTQQEVEVARRNRSLLEMQFALEKLSTEAERKADRTSPLTPLADDAPLQPRDQLTIMIAGEPDLATSYTVRADGSIRFPFLGTIRIQGSSPEQVRLVMQKLLVDKGLAQNPTITVSARRPLGAVR